jgi:hypothetical protein
LIMLQSTAARRGCSGTEMVSELSSVPVEKFEGDGSRGAGTRGSRGGVSSAPPARASSGCLYSACGCGDRGDFRFGGCGSELELCVDERF